MLRSRSLAAPSTSPRAGRFCRALFEEQRGDMRRMASIDSVAERLGIDYDKAVALAAELKAADLVRIGGGHSVPRTKAGRQRARTPVARRLSKR